MAPLWELSFFHYLSFSTHTKQNIYRYITIVLEKPSCRKCSFVRFLKKIENNPRKYHCMFYVRVLSLSARSSDSNIKSLYFFILLTLYKCGGV